MSQKTETKLIMHKKSNFLTLVLLIIATYFIAPLAWLVISSTKNTTDIYSTFGLWFGRSIHFWDNIKLVFQSDNGIFINWVMNSLVYSVSGAVGAAILATMAGYGFSKYDFVGAKMMFRFTLGAVMIPTAALSNSPPSFCR